MPPDALTIFDLLEFSARNIANPIKRGYHGFFGHYHLDFQRDEGLKEFVADVNRLLARNGIGFELTAEGKRCAWRGPTARRTCQRFVPKRRH